MKRLIAALVCLAALLPAMALAQTSTLRVTADRTSVRDRAATDGAVVTTVTRGEILEILETSGVWFRVRVQGSNREGFVHSLFVERIGGPVPAAPPPPSAPAPAAAPAPSAPPPSPDPAPRQAPAAQASSSGGFSTTPPSQLGFGLSILGDDGGFGGIVDYFMPIRTQGAANAIGIAADVSFHRKGYDEDEFGIDGNVSQLLATGGVRYAGQVGENMSWHAQGLFGIVRASVGGDLGDECEATGACPTSDTSWLINVGGAFQYWLSERGAIRGQLDFPFGDGWDTTRFSVMYVLKMGGN